MFLKCLGLRFSDKVRVVLPFAEIRIRWVNVLVDFPLSSLGSDGVVGTRWSSARIAGGLEKRKW